MAKRTAVGELLSMHNAGHQVRSTFAGAQTRNYLQFKGVNGTFKQP
jgi:hypothetical protein